MASARMDLFRRGLRGIDIPIKLRDWRVFLGL